MPTITDYEPEAPKLDIDDAQLELDLMALREQVAHAEASIRELIPARNETLDEYMYHLGEGSNAYAMGDKNMWLAHKRKRDSITKATRKPLEAAKEKLADIVEQANPLEDEALRREGKFFVYRGETLGNTVKTVSAPIHSPEWHAARAQGIGGSDIAAILDISPWTSREELLNLKAGITQPEPSRATGALRRGAVQEDAIARRYALTHETDSVFVNCKDSWKSSVVEYQNANLDGLVYSEDGLDMLRIVEIKTSSTPASWVDGVPDYYRLQALWYMDAVGLHEADFAVLLDDVDYREFRISPHTGEMESIHEQVAEFVKEVAILRAA